MSAKKPDQGLLFIALVLAGILLLCLFLCIGPFLLGRIALWRHQNKWNAKGGTDYTITIMDQGGIVLDGFPAFGTLEICDGKVVRVNDLPCEQVIHNGRNACDWDPVKALFHEARSCVFLYSIEYDNNYGFPMSIRYKNFIEGGALKIRDFRLTTCSQPITDDQAPS